MFIQITRFLLIGSACILPISLAQEVSVRFVAQKLPAELGKILMVSGNGKESGMRSVAFDLPMNNLTGPLITPGRKFFITQIDKTQPLATVSLPETGSDFIVLLLIGETGFTPVILPDNDVSFKPGDIYLHNTSAIQIFGQVGTIKVALNPGQGQILKPAGAVNDAYYSVAFAVKEKKRARYLTTSRWPATDRTRVYVFFYDDPRNQRVSFRAVDELIAAE